MVTEVGQSINVFETCVSGAVKVIVPVVEIRIVVEVGYPAVLKKRKIIFNIRIKYDSTCYETRR